MEKRTAPGRLYVVATPIGNVDDITLRAREVLARVDLIAAEDTRHTGRLLARLGIDRPMAAVHEHNEEQQAARLIERIEQGASIALVSDAGTPLVSDPGYRLVTQAARRGIEVVAIPGPSAVTAALSISGLPTDRFVFEGFLPARATARQKRLTGLRTEPRTMVFFESSHRIEGCLADLRDVLGAGRQAALCRELTKQFETVLRGSIADLHDQVSHDPNQRKGEFVLIVAGSTSDDDAGFAAALALAAELLDHVGASQAARIGAKLHGVSRRDLYRALEQSRGNAGEAGSEPTPRKS
jgi:16S rRNA (cytidine1402-2'-O)-methyltransferase